MWEFGISRFVAVGIWDWGIGDPGILGFRNLGSSTEAESDPEVYSNLKKKTLYKTSKP